MLMHCTACIAMKHRSFTAARMLFRQMQKLSAGLEKDERASEGEGRKCKSQSVCLLHLAHKGRWRRHGQHTIVFLHTGTDISNSYTLMPLLLLLHVCTCTTHCSLHTLALPVPRQRLV